MILQLIALFGFALFGYVLPEFFDQIGSGNKKIPGGQNIVSALSSACISAFFIFS